MDENKRLALRLKKHDEKALDIIILKYTPLVSSVIYNISDGALSKEDIEELASDTFVSLWKNADRFDSEKPVDIDETDIEDDYSINESTELKEMAEELKKAVDLINEPDREILIRHYFYYQKIEYISECMNISPATVKVKLHRTRKKLKKILTERGFGL